MSDDLWDPENEDGLAFSGKHADGSITVTVQTRVQIPDDLALPARHLVDGEGLQPDWGSEVAAAQRPSTREWVDRPQLAAPKALRLQPLRGTVPIPR